MFTSLLYHACGIRGYTLTKTEFDGGIVLFHVESQPRQCCCSACGSSNVIRRGSQKRRIRNVSIGRHWTFVIADLPRVECRDCHVVRQIEIGFAEPRRGYTKALAQYILDLAPHLTMRRPRIGGHRGEMASGIRVLQQFARTLLAQAAGILNWYDYPISTGPLEGTHNKIKTMQRQHYGLRDQEFFRLKIYAIHRAKYALVG